MSVGSFQLLFPQVSWNEVFAVSLDDAGALQFATVPHQALASCFQSSAFICVTCLPLWAFKFVFALKPREKFKLCKSSLSMELNGGEQARGLGDKARGGPSREGATGLLCLLGSD